jgi:hypothetical protein
MASLQKEPSAEEILLPDRRLNKRDRSASIQSWRQTVSATALQQSNKLRK